MGDVTLPWIAAPKNRALYHLLQVTGNALEAVLPDRAAELDQAKRSLRTSHADRLATTIECEVDGRRFSLAVASDRVRFYRRGDVPSLVANRPSEFDDRESNWTAGIAIWAELLSFDASERSAAARAAEQLAPTASTGHRPMAPLVVLMLNAALIAAGGILGTAIGSVALLGAVAASSIAAGAAPFFDFARRSGTLTLSAVLGTVTVLSIDPDLDQAKLVAYAASALGAGAIAGRLALIQRWLGLGISLLAGGLAGFAGTRWIVLVTVLVVGDALASAVGANSLPVRHHVAVLGCVLASGLGARWVWANPFGGSADTGETSGTYLLVGLAVAVVITVGVEFVHGTRDVLAPGALPLVAWIGASVAPDGQIQRVLATVALVALAANLVVLRLPRPKKPMHATTPASSPSPHEQPVEIRRRTR